MRVLTSSTGLELSFAELMLLSYSSAADLAKTFYSSFSIWLSVCE